MARWALGVSEVEEGRYIAHQGASGKDGGHANPPTRAEIDRLFQMFKEHIEECNGFEESDRAALDEFAKVWKIVQAIRRVGAWFWRLVVKAGGFAIRAGAVLTALMYLYQQLKGLGGK